MAGNKQQGQGGQQQQSQPKPIKIVVETEAPQKVGGAYQIFCTAIVSQGDKALGGRDIQFFLNGVDFGAPAQTDDDNGRVPILFQGIPLDAKVVTVEAQVVGTAHRYRKVVSLPEEPKKSVGVPAELVVDPTRIGNKITIFARVVDEEGRGVPRTKITVVDGVNVGTVPTDEDGEYILSFELQPHEEREIAIYVAGYGDEGHRQTFKWRRI